MSLLQLRHWLNWIRQPQKSNTKSGFTLTELLISIIIGSLIVTGLMSLVVELVSVETRETSRTETQREMQMALDFISTDLREAVYVYDGSCLADEGAAIIQSKCSGIFAKGYVNIPENSVPILAFWRLDDLPEEIERECKGNPNFAVDNTIAPCIAGRMYTLVVYFLSRNDPGDPTWQGRARILRSTLPMFRDNEVVPGYVEPEAQGVSFESWPENNDGTSQQNGNPPALSFALVDFVDDRAMNEISELGSNPTVDCPPEYVLTPSDTTLDGQGFGNMRNFFACVKLPNEFLSAAAEEGEDVGAFNQKVILFLRGNAEGKPGIDTANRGFMPAIQTQVLNRGVKDKRPRSQ